MKKLGAILLLCGLGALVLWGCSEEDLKPYFTRLDTSGECGVAPFPVEFYAVATGGNEFDKPTGANLYLEINWDFGDGSGLSGSSIAYHTYATPDSYLVTVTVKDKDGDTASDGVWIDVRLDTLDVWVTSMPQTEASVGDTVLFNFLASGCGFAPQDGDYGRFRVSWTLDNSTQIQSRLRQFRHVFTSGDVGTRRATVRVEDPALALTRRASIDLNIVPAPELPR